MLMLSKKQQRQEWKGCPVKDGGIVPHWKGRGFGGGSGIEGRGLTF